MRGNYAKPWPERVRRPIPGNISFITASNSTIVRQHGIVHHSNIIAIVRFIRINGSYI
jgi:hypothetical protein